MTMTTVLKFAVASVSAQETPLAAFFHETDAMMFAEAMQQRFPASSYIVIQVRSKLVEFERVE